MPLLDLQRRLRELGRIRIGAQVPATSKTGKAIKRPTKLQVFRLTSPSEDLITAAAEAYGGTARPWTDAPGDQPQFEVITTSDRLEAVVPPASSFDQHWELWSGGGCQRRCNGEEELLGERDCLCPVDHNERMKLAAEGKACKPTSRLNLILPQLPDIGVWRLETHGYYAAMELAGAQQICSLATARGHMIPVTLRLEQREIRRPGQPTMKFAVPVLEISARLREVFEALELGGNGPLLLGPQAALRALPAPQADERLRQLGNGEAGARTGPSLEQGLARVAEGEELRRPEPRGHQRRSADLPGKPGGFDEEFAGAEPPEPDAGESAPLPTGAEELPEVPMATKKQQGMLHGTAKKLGWSEEEAHELAGVAHYSELTKERATELLDSWIGELNAREGNRATDGEPPSNPPSAGGRTQPSPETSVAGARSKGEGAPANGLEDPLFTFGLYKGRPFSEIAREAPGVLKELAKSATSKKLRALAAAWLERTGSEQGALL